jgi:hypothetical protein
MGGLLQLSPQLPQFAASDCEFDSQPSASEPLQFWKGALQLMPQEPTVHVGLPLVELHTFGQLPQ